MSYNSIGLLKANGQIEEYGNTGGGDGSGGGGGDTSIVESQIGNVETTGTATSAHAVGSYFIDADGQFVKTTSAIAVGDTISEGTESGDNCVATDIAEVLTILNNSVTGINNQWFKATNISTDPYTINTTGKNCIVAAVDAEGNVAASIILTYNKSLFTLINIVTNEDISISMQSTSCVITHTNTIACYVFYLE